MSTCVEDEAYPLYANAIEGAQKKAECGLPQMLLPSVCSAKDDDATQSTTTSERRGGTKSDNLSPHYNLTFTKDFQLLRKW